jgi:CBS domain-containing protein
VQFTLGERAPLSLLLTHEAVAVTRGTSVESVASFMLRMGLSTLPVVDGDGRLLGTVSTQNLLAEAVADHEAVEPEARRQPRERATLSDALDRGGRGSSLSTASVGDAMTPSTLALRDDASVSHAVMALTREGKSELPVRCEHCQGYCIVSALELLGWLSRSRQEAR